MYVCVYVASILNCLVSFLERNTRCCKANYWGRNSQNIWHQSRSFNSVHCGFWELNRPQLLSSPAVHHRRHHPNLPPQIIKPHPGIQRALQRRRLEWFQHPFPLTSGPQGLPYSRSAGRLPWPPPAAVVASLCLLFLVTALADGGARGGEQRKDSVLWRQKRSVWCIFEAIWKGYGGILGS